MQGAGLNTRFAPYPHPFPRSAITLSKCRHRW